MLALKIIAIVVLSIIALIILLTMQNIKLTFYFSTEKRLMLRVKYSFITLFDLEKANKKKKKANTDGNSSTPAEGEAKKESKFKKFIMRRLGLTPITGIEGLKENTKSTSLVDTTTRVITIFTLFAGQLMNLLKRMRVKRFGFNIVVAGDDAADTAMQYGLICSAVYPFIGYLDANIKESERIDLNVACDFEGEPFLDCDIYLKLRLIHVTNALLKSIVTLARTAQKITPTEDEK